MEVLTAIVVGALFSIGLYLMLRRNAFQLFVGVVIITHAVNLLIFASGGLSRGSPPLLGEDAAPPFSDPVPQALVLTAIVIGLGLQSFLLVLVQRLIKALGTPDLDQARSTEPGEPRAPRGDGGAP